MRIVQTHQFKKDIKRQQKRGKNLQAIKDVIELLAAGKLLSARHRDHALTGDWSGWRDCHVEPDWLMIYKASNEELLLGRTGTHADLF
jgi:mRNA interferase YafQ